MIGVYYNPSIAILVLAIDFTLRAFTDGHYSPVKSVSKTTVSTLKIKPMLTHAAPKKFAISLGVVLHTNCVISINYRIFMHSSFIKYQIPSNITPFGRDIVKEDAVPILSIRQK
jgi:hypothetical protein